MKLNDVAKEIREVIKKRQEEVGLIFEEEGHKYTMMGRTNYPSVSTVIKNFYDEFPKEEISYSMAMGDVEVQKRLIEEWEGTGKYASNMGSRVHYELEKEIIRRNSNYKEVRKPIFECDITQLIKGDAMIKAGKRYISLMESRNCVLIDTETVLGDPGLGYVGQPDKLWLTKNKTGNSYGILITDWKTNLPKSFLEKEWTTRMRPPFEIYPNNALGHYYIQLPFYGKLFLEMMKGSKFEGLKLYGGIIVHLKEDGNFDEYRIPNDVIDSILAMDMKKYLV